MKARWLPSVMGGLESPQSRPARLGCALSRRAARAAQMSAFDQQQPKLAASHDPRNGSVRPNIGERPLVCSYRGDAAHLGWMRGSTCQSDGEISWRTVPREPTKFTLPNLHPKSSPTTARNFTPRVVSAIASNRSSMTGAASCSRKYPSLQSAILSVFGSAAETVRSSAW